MINSPVDFRKGLAYIQQCLLSAAESAVCLSWWQFSICKITTLFSFRCIPDSWSISTLETNKSRFSDGYSHRIVYQFKSLVGIWKAYFISWFVIWIADLWICYIFTALGSVDLRTLLSVSLFSRIRQACYCLLHSLTIF